MVVLHRVSENGNARLGLAWWILKDHVGSGSFPRLTCMGGGDAQQILVVMTAGRFACRSLLEELRRGGTRARAGGGEGPSEGACERRARSASPVERRLPRHDAQPDRADQNGRQAGWLAR